MNKKSILVFGAYGLSNSKAITKAAKIIKNSIHNKEVCILNSIDYFDFTFNSINTNIKNIIENHDYTICTSSFENDVYPEKFFDIVCRNANIWVDFMVLVIEPHEQCDINVIDFTLKTIKNIYSLPIIVFIISNNNDESNILEFLTENDYYFFKENDEFFCIDDHIKIHTSPSYLYDYALAIKSKIELFATNFFPNTKITYQNNTDNIIAKLEHDYSILPIYFLNTTENYDLYNQCINILKVRLQLEAELLIVEYSVMYSGCN